MSARHKLNSAHLLGSGLIAGLIGGLCESWLIFALVWAGLIASGLQNDEIRPSPRSRPSRRSR